MLALLAAPQAAWAAASAWAHHDQGAVRLVSAVEAVGQAGDLRLGLEFQLEKGWKIYWRSPGDAGFPPSVDWAGSDNLGEARLAWPFPHRFSVVGLETTGYKDSTLLPVTVRPAIPGQPLHLHAAVDYLTCERICVPRHADLVLDLPAGPAVASPEAHLIGRYAAQVPGDGAAVGLTLVRAEAEGQGDAAVLTVTVAAEPPLAAPDMFVEAAGGAQFGAPRVVLSQGGRRAELTAHATSGTVKGPLAGQALTVTIGEDGRALEARITPAPAASRWGPLAAMLGMALVGGLILNLMPCVLPVLSIKVLGLIGHGGGERRHIRMNFLASAGGIVASFVAMAAAAIAVKAAGNAVGWGLQFQQPLFLVAMVVLLTLFSANLWGWFEIGLPHWLGGLGRGYGHPHSLGGHFLAGAFATLLATPCTAPFLGTAIGFALSRGAVEILAIFTALGLGMAAPYLAIAAWPQAAQQLPRPGRWMVRVKQLLGVALAGTAGWLLTVLSAQAGTGPALAIAGLMAAALIALGLRPRLPGGMRPAAAAVVAALALLAFAVPFQADSRPRQASVAEAGWVPFDQAAIPRLVAEGKTVFVDVTADWCITCKVNKLTVLAGEPVAARLHGPGLVAMRADWTRPDDGIAAYLAGFGRYGIPFDAVYGPGAPAGLGLPELLTSEAVTTALDRAGTR